MPRDLDSLTRQTALLIPSDASAGSTTIRPSLGFAQQWIRGRRVRPSPDGHFSHAAAAQVESILREVDLDSLPNAIDPLTSQIPILAAARAEVVSMKITHRAGSSLTPGSVVRVVCVLLIACTMLSTCCPLELLRGNEKWQSGSPWVPDAFN